MSVRAKVDAFEAWLQRTGTSEELACFHRSIAEGLVAVAGASAVTAAHVEMSCKLARDAGMDVTQMERLGALFVRYAQSGGATPAAEPEATLAAAPEATLAAEPEVTPDATPEPRAEPAPEPVAAKPERAQTAPLVVSFRAPTPAPVLDDEPEAAPPRPAPRRRLPGALAALGALALLGAAVVWHARGDATADAPAPAAPGGLAALGIDADLPAGWRVAPASATSLGPMTAALVAHGADADPDDRAFVAALPLADALGSDAEPSDDALVAAAQRAESGTAARLASEGGAYQSGGCAIAPIAARTAVCRGTIHAGAEVLALQTYLRLGEARAVVALFVAKLSVTDPARDADAVVRGLRL